MREHRAAPARSFRAVSNMGKRTPPRDPDELRLTRRRILTTIGVTVVGLGCGSNDEPLTISDGGAGAGGVGGAGGTAGNAGSGAAGSAGWAGTGASGGSAGGGSGGTGDARDAGGGHAGTDGGQVSDASPDAADGQGPPDGGPDAMTDARPTGADADSGVDAGIEAGGRDGQATDGGATCDESTRLSPAELLAPIDTIVVLMMENRSFDHYLGSLELVEGRTVDGLTGNESNPDPSGNAVRVFNLLDFTPSDPPHSWEACHAQFNGGKNDGFVTEHAGASQNEVMGYHLRSQIPITYALADAGAICDHWFASVMGPTWPNRCYLHGGTSNGVTTNTPVFGFDSVFARLDQAGISNKNYFHDVAWALGGYAKILGNAAISEFFDDAANGTLPHFSIIDPQYFGAGANDDHPDHDIQLGQALISSIYSALANSPQWKKLLFIITYDEHGGFFDHVVPPTVVDERAQFEQLGFRVPSLVLGPYARRGCAVATRFEHVSVIKTLMTKFGIPSLNPRVEAANDLSPCIQPSFLSSPQPPIKLPQLTIHRARLLARPRSTSHRELAEAVRRRRPPAGLDLRSEGIGQSEHMLAWGQKLGALVVR